MTSSGKIFSLFFISSLLLSGNAFAQDQVQGYDDRPNRLSIGIMGNLTKGHMNVGTAFQSGVNASFEFQEQFNNTLGFNIRYVASPEIALQSNIVYGRFTILSDIFNDDLYFDNNYLTTSLSTQLSLLRLFGASPGSFNIYGSFGTGLMFNNVSINSNNPEINRSEISSRDHPSTTFFTSFGGGIRFNLGPRIDSFAQYEYSSASRDIVDGNFLGELLNLGGSAKTSSSWSAVTVGIQFKFGSGSRDADWPAARRTPAQPPLGDRDLFREMEEQLIARQAEMYQEEIESLRGLIDSLQANLLTEEEAQETFSEQYANTISEFQSRIDSLEQSIARERERADYNENEIDSLTRLIESLESNLAAEQEAKESQEEHYSELVNELHARIELLEEELEETLERAERDVGEVIIREEDPGTGVEQRTSADEVPEPEDAARLQPELQGIKEIEPESDPEDITVPEEPREPEDETADTETEVPIREEESTVFAEEPDDEFHPDEDTAAVTEPDPEYDEAVTDDDGSRAWWFILAILSLAAGGLYYFTRGIFTSAPAATKETAGHEPPKPAEKPKPAYTVPEHSVIVNKDPKPSASEKKPNQQPVHAGSTEKSTNPVFAFLGSAVAGASDFFTDIFSIKSKNEQ
jgi:hypothetical protein